MVGPRTVGIMMIAIGLLALTLATLQHFRALHTLRAQWPELPKSLSWVTAMLLALLGVIALARRCFEADLATPQQPPRNSPWPLKKPPNARRARRQHARRERPRCSPAAQKRAARTKARKAPAVSARAKPRTAGSPRGKPLRRHSLGRHHLSAVLPADTVAQEQQQLFPRNGNAGRERNANLVPGQYADSTHPGTGRHLHHGRARQRQALLLRLR